MWKGERKRERGGGRVSVRTMATMATGSEISNKMPSRGFINVASPMCSLAHKTTPDTGCTQIKATCSGCLFYECERKQNLLQSWHCVKHEITRRTGQTRALDEGTPFSHSQIPLPLPIPLSLLNSSLSESQLLRLNCQHPGEQQQQRAVVKAVAPRAMPPHRQLPRNHFVCVFNASGVDCYNNIAHRADLRL